MNTGTSATTDLAGRIPDRGDAVVEIEGREVSLTSLEKPWWPGGWTKGDALRWYATAAPHLLPHLAGRPLVMKRYPDGIEGKRFFQKRTPGHAPEWLVTCSVEHGSGSVIDFVVVDGPAALLWAVQLGSIDLNPWPSRCDDVNRPDLLCFDLDPVPGATFADVRRTALVVGQALTGLGAPFHAKTSGSRGIHLYVPIRRGPPQKDVWRVAKTLALSLEALHPDLITAVYRKADRPRGRVLVDYNQNAWGRTIASVYSLRPRPGAPVSAPVTWDELEAGIEIEDLTIESMPGRLADVGDRWAPLIDGERLRLESLLEGDVAAG